MTVVGMHPSTCWGPYQHPTAISSHLQYAYAYAYANAKQAKVFCQEARIQQVHKCIYLYIFGNNVYMKQNALHFFFTSDALIGAFFRDLEEKKEK